LNKKAPLCGCEICALKIDFELDDHLLGEIESKNCVVFAGAGVSTETGGAHPDTLYQTLKHETAIDHDMEFWELVDAFEMRPNGRQKLVQLIKDRFSYIDAFRDLHWRATRFHRALGNAPYFQTIITTNWDRYFEDVIGATPFVYDSDIPFWQNAARSVIKIHGSIDNYSSIVASTADYANCEARLREGALGAVVKQIFSTKTCVFFGYSARDSDFRQIFDTIKQGLGQFARSHYLVSPYISDQEAFELKDSLGIIAIRTDATHFVEIIKSHMNSKLCFSREESFDKIAVILNSFRDLHIKFTGSFHPKRNPHLIFAAAYQDGVIHAFERILDRAMMGDFANLHDVQMRISNYEKKISGYRKCKNYWDLAYFSGYQNGLMQFLLVNEETDSDIADLPEFFHPGKGELYEDDYEKLVRPNPNVHKGALRDAMRRAAQFSDDPDLTIQHPPWG
jgi:NAD-dependent SIR2 family protein deacetylase